jgi:hypothetical protein
MTASPGTTSPVGLCISCRWRRVIESGTGSRFSLCERSRGDSRYPRYPRLPVLACPGYEPMTPEEESP